MDKRFLNKVVEQIVRETRLDRDERRLYTPFTPVSSSYHHVSFPHFLHIPLFFPFSEHCKNVYGLNEDEVSYVWDKYRYIIKDKLNNGL